MCYTVHTCTCTCIIHVYEHNVYCGLYKSLRVHANCNYRGCPYHIQCTLSMCVYMYIHTRTCMYTMYTVHVYSCTQFIQYTTVPVKRNLHFKQESQEIPYAKNTEYNGIQCEMVRDRVLRSCMITQSHM